MLWAVPQCRGQDGLKAWRQTHVGLGKVNSEAVRRAEGEEVAHRAIFGVTKTTIGLYKLSKGRVLTHLLTQLGCLPCNCSFLKLMDLMQP